MDQPRDDREPDPGGSELGVSIGLLRRRRKAIVVCLLVGVAAGAAYTVLAPKSFDASATVALRNISAAPFAGTDQQSGTAVDNQTQQLVASSLVVAEFAQRQLHTSTSPIDLLANLTVTAPAKTAILIFSYTAPTALGSAQGANAFANGYLQYSADQARGLQSETVAALGGRLANLNEQVAKLETTLALAPHGSVQASQAQALLSLQNAELNSLRNGIASAQSVVIDPGTVVAAAVPPTSASSPQPALGLGGGALLGLVVGLILAAARDRSDDRLRHRGEIGAQCAPLPVLLEVAARGGRPDPLELEDPGSPLETAVSELCSRLVVSGLSPGMVITVAPLPGTSPDQNTPMLLAAGVADSGCLTVLVRGDAASAATGEDPETEAEFAKLTGGSLPMESSLHPVDGYSRLWVLDLKSRASAPGTVTAILDGLAERGYVVVAALGAANQARTQLASLHADAALLVATAVRTRARDLRFCADGFTAAGIPVLGVVLLNRRQTRAGDRPPVLVAAGAQRRARSSGVEHSSHLYESLTPAQA